MVYAHTVSTTSCLGNQRPVVGEDQRQGNRASFDERRTTIRRGRYKVGEWAHLATTAFSSSHQHAYRFMYIQSLHTSAESHDADQCPQWLLLYMAHGTFCYHQWIQDWTFTCLLPCKCPHLSPHTYIISWLASAQTNACLVHWFNSAYSQVEWSDINAALGQAMLLFSTLVDLTGFKFRQYRLQPLGSFSKIIKMDDASNRLNLYYDENFTFFPKRNFNSALLSFLQCIEVRDLVCRMRGTERMDMHIQ